MHHPCAAPLQLSRCGLLALHHLRLYPIDAQSHAGRTTLLASGPGLPEVGPVEAALEDLTLLEVQLHDHIRLHTGRGCGCQGHHRHLHNKGWSAAISLSGDVCVMYADDDTLMHWFCPLGESVRFWQGCARIRPKQALTPNRTGSVTCRQTDRQLVRTSGKRVLNKPSPL